MRMNHRSGWENADSSAATCVAIAGLALLTGCGKLSGEAPPSLAETAWKLVEIQSMDDAQGTTKPEGNARYEMRLHADGTFVMQLNCNTASGSWKAEPCKEPSSGGFSFGSLAATMALCPPPSLDEKIATQASFVRSYRLKDGRLSLVLMADGGIHLWEPLASK
jgi:heat shock protein HslJ